MEQDERIVLVVQTSFNSIGSRKGNEVRALGVSQAVNARRATAMCLAVLVVCFLLAAGRVGADASLDNVERDLLEILTEMTAIESELDRLEEFAAFPKATGVRIEVHRGGDVAAPVRARLLLHGSRAEERELSAGDREAFSGPVSVPIIVRLPCLPGEHRVRVELYHPSWKSPSSSEFRVRIKAGNIFTVRLRLAPDGDKPPPSLSLIGEK